MAKTKKTITLLDTLVKQNGYLLETLAAPAFEAEFAIGKAKLAKAIRQKGVNVSGDESFTKLSDAIDAIPLPFIDNIVVDMSSNNIVNKLYGNLQTNIDIARSFKGKFSGYNGYFCVEYLSTVVNSDGQTKVTGADAYFFSDGSPLLEAESRTAIYYHTWNNANLYDGKYFIVYFYKEEDYRCELNGFTNVESVVIGGKPISITQSNSNFGFGIFMLEETEVTNVSLGNPNAVNIYLLNKSGSISISQNSVTTNLSTPNLESITGTISGLSMLYNWNLDKLKTADTYFFNNCAKLRSLNLPSFEKGNLPTGTFSWVNLPIAEEIKVHLDTTISNLIAPKLKSIGSTNRDGKNPHINYGDSIKNLQEILGTINIDNCPEEVVFPNLTYLYGIKVAGCKRAYFPALEKVADGYHILHISGNMLEELYCPNLTKYDVYSMIVDGPTTSLRVIYCPKCSHLSLPGYTGHPYTHYIKLEKVVVDDFDFSGYVGVYQFFGDCPRLIHLELGASGGTQTNNVRLGEYCPTEAFSKVNDDLVEDHTHFSNNYEQWVWNFEHLIVDRLVTTTWQAKYFTLDSRTIAQLSEEIIEKITSKGWTLVSQDN